VPVDTRRGGTWHGARSHRVHAGSSHSSYFTRSLLDPQPRRVRAAVRPNPSRTTPRYCRSRTPSDVSALAHTAHTYSTHISVTSAWHIRPVAAPGFGPRRTADNTARTIRHIAASAAPSSLSATRTRCGTRHESSAYTSGAFPSPATAPHAFVAAPPSFVSDVGSLPT